MQSTLGSNVTQDRWFEGRIFLEIPEGTLKTRTSDNNTWVRREILSQDGDKWTDEEKEQCEIANRKCVMKHHTIFGGGERHHFADT